MGITNYHVVGGSRKNWPKGTDPRILFYHLIDVHADIDDMGTADSAWPHNDCIVQSSAIANYRFELKNIAESIQDLTERTTTSLLAFKVLYGNPGPT